jgi:hypothetical protein
MENNKAAANFNMTFNGGSFIKNKEYYYRYVDETKEKVIVTTEERKMQEFPFSEFNILFTVLTI